MAQSLRTKIWNHFQTIQQINLATIDGDRPRVRPMMMIQIDSSFYVATFKSDAKAKQIAANPNIEFCLELREGRKSGYIRGCGVAEARGNIGIKQMILNMIPPFSRYFKSAEDPNYALFELVLERIEYMPVGMDNVERLEL